MATIRVLSLVTSTDSSGPTDRALTLHEQLSSFGFEVRTLAVAPGVQQGGHESTLPVIAPSRRSLSAHTQTYAESRWADAIIVSEPGLLSLLRYTTLRSKLPIVAISNDEEAAAQLVGPRWWNKQLTAHLNTVQPDQIDQTSPTQWQKLLSRCH